MLDCLELCFRFGLNAALVETELNRITAAAFSESTRERSLERLAAWLCRLSPQSDGPPQKASTDRSNDDYDAWLERHSSELAPYRNFPAAWDFEGGLHILFPDADPAAVISKYVGTFYLFATFPVSTRVSCPASMKRVVGTLIDTVIAASLPDNANRSPLLDLADCFHGRPYGHSHPTPQPPDGHAKEMLRVCTDANATLACAWIMHVSWQNRSVAVELPNGHYAFSSREFALAEERVCLTSTAIAVRRLHDRLSVLQREHTSRWNELKATIPDSLGALLGAWSMVLPALNARSADLKSAEAMEDIRSASIAFCESLRGIADDHFHGSIPCSPSDLLVFEQQEEEASHSFRRSRLHDALGFDIRFLLMHDREGSMFQLATDYCLKFDSGSDEGWFDTAALSVNAENYRIACESAFRQGYDELAVALLSFGVATQAACREGGLFWNQKSLQHLVSRGLSTTHRAMLDRALELTVNTLPDGLDKLLLSSHRKKDKAAELPLLTKEGVELQTKDRMGPKTWIRLCVECKNHLVDGEITLARMSLDLATLLRSKKTLVQNYALALEAELLHLMAPFFRDPGSAAYLKSCGSRGKPTLGTVTSLLFRSPKPEVRDALSRTVKRPLSPGLTGELSEIRRIRNAASHSGQINDADLDLIRTMIFSNRIFERLHAHFH